VGWATGAHDGCRLNCVVVWQRCQLRGCAEGELHDRLRRSVAEGVGEATKLRGSCCGLVDQRHELRQPQQASIRLVLDKVTEVGSVRPALLWFLEHKLDLPERRRNGTIVWTHPRFSTIHNTGDHGSL
jgi:hypothetical protein